MKVALIQQRMSERVADNRDASAAAIRRAASEGVQLVLLPELHASLYPCKQEHTASFELAERIPGPTTEALAGLADELGIVIVGSVFERRAPGVYHNTAVVLDSDGRLAGTYRKMHIPDDPGYFEKFYFTPGDLGFRPIDTSLGRLGVLVCWDQWFPEAARLMTLAGAELLLYPSAIGWDPADDGDEQRRQLEAWQTVQRAHAIANGLPLLCCNRVGLERDPHGRFDADFWGASFVCGPQGELLAQASHEDEAILVADIDAARTETVRRTWPYLRDRRIDAYQGLLERYGDHRFE